MALALAAPSALVDPVWPCVFTATGGTNYVFSVVGGTILAVADGLVTVSPIGGYTAVDLAVTVTANGSSVTTHATVRQGSLFRPSLGGNYAVLSPFYIVDSVDPPPPPVVVAPGGFGAAYGKAFGA